MPAAEPSGWFVTTIPREPVAGCFSQVKEVVIGGGLRRNARSR